MSSILGLIRAEPVSFNGVIVAATGLAILLGLPEEIGGAIAVFIGAVVTWLIRSQVNTVAKTVQATTEAATAAAAETAKQLTDETVGPLGRVSDTATQVVARASEDAVANTLTDLGFKQKNRRAA
jgi:hypothetical protein